MAKKVKREKWKSRVRKSKGAKALAWHAERVVDELKEGIGLERLREPTPDRSLRPRDPRRRAGS